MKKRHIVRVVALIGIIGILLGAILPALAG